MRTINALEKRILLPEDLGTLNSLDEYKAAGGLLGLEKARSMKPQEVIDEVKESGLRGRGGAGFPTAVKWQTVVDDEEPNKYVVCNMAEGEPGTYKDRYLLLKNPYIVFEGMLIVAHAIGAKEAIIGTKEKFKDLVKRLQGALKEYEDAGLVEPGYVRIVLGPDEYLFGEEKALLEVIDGRDPMPRLYPPFMSGVGAQTGVHNPTVVNNAESMSHLTHILAKGADWFKGLGTEDTPGTIMVTLTGDVKRAGMFEVEAGLTVNQMLNDLGEGPHEGRKFKAVFSGVANRTLTEDLFDTVIDFGSMREKGVGLGSGGFVVYDDSRFMPDIAWMFSKFLSVSSCGQCIPCNMGSRLITQHLENIIRGEGTKEDVDSILVETERCTNQTRCFLPVQESVLVSSIIEKFPEEFKPGFDNSSFNRDLIIPKVADFSDESNSFTFETDPKEFR